MDSQYVLVHELPPYLVISNVWSRLKSKTGLFILFIYLFLLWHVLFLICCAVTKVLRAAVKHSKFSLPSLLILRFLHRKLWGLEQQQLHLNVFKTSSLKSKLFKKNTTPDLS